MKNASFALLNIAITHRNLAVRRGNDRLRSGWEARAKYYAQRLGTQLVPMPDNPSALTAEAFRNLFA